MLKFNKKEKFIKELIKKMKEDYIDESCAQCAYYTILSFVPFLILLITLIQYTSINEQTLFDLLSKIIPISMNEVIIGIIKEVYSKSFGTISVSIIFTLWSAGNGFFALMKSFNRIYGNTDKKKNSYLYLKILSLLKTMVFIVLIIGGLLVLVFGKSYFDMFKEFGNYSRIVTDLVLVVITIIIFLLIYMSITKHKLSLKDQLYGAIIGGVALNIVSNIFSKFLVIFKGFSIMYGSLTTLMLVMMWVYAFFYILFLGCEINMIYCK